MTNKEIIDHVSTKGNIVFYGAHTAEMIEAAKEQARADEREKYGSLRSANPERDKIFSPLHDAVMSAICHNLKTYCKDNFDAVWSYTLFPERLTNEILRIIEKNFTEATNE